MQAVAGGTTTLQESHSLEKSAGLLEENVLLRSTANPNDMDYGTNEKIMSIVDFFRPNDQNQPDETWAVNKYREDRSAGALVATLAHLAEGRSGLSGSEPDPYTRLEFETFMQHEVFQDAELVRSSPLSLIHGCGIDPYNPEHTRFLRERQISVVWSPVSNLLLYGDTIDVGTLINEGVNVALGSDWSPSGSKHVWDEARFARFYLEALGDNISDAQIFQMVTVNAARCLGNKVLGRLKVGAMADFFILRSPLETDNPLEVFFKTTDEHVMAVMVSGEPIYGQRDFLEGFGRQLQGLPKLEGSAVADKAVHLPEGLKNAQGEPLDIDRDITKLENMMKEPPAPLEATMRSNLLASSDTPYRARISKLKSDAVYYAWRVQRARRQRERG